MITDEGVELPESNIGNVSNATNTLVSHRQMEIMKTSREIGTGKYLRRVRQVLKS